MPRIIEIDDPVQVRNYGDSGGYGGALYTLSVIIILIMLILWASGYWPWYVNFPVVTTPVEGVSRPFSNVSYGIADNNVSYVIADNLNLRLGPDYYSDVIYVLPRGTRVDILGESYQEPYGDVWLRVRVQTFDGWQFGWVNQRYIA